MIVEGSALQRVEDFGGMFNMIDQHTVHAMVLTGGRSSRMGGRHKPGILVGGRSVIDRTLSALWSAVPSAEVVIAGSDAGLSPNLRQQVTVVREDPPFSGPLAGVAAAMEGIPHSDGVVLLLGGDLPFLSSETMTKLVGAVTAGAPVASCLDATGHLQYLCSSWDQHVLRDQFNDISDATNMPLRALFAGLHPELIDCDPNELRDIDTPEDLARAVTTSDGRPVPEALLAAVEYLGADPDGNDLGLNPDQTVEILEFARNVKYSSSAANPVVAAFLAGQLAGSQDARSVGEALRSVLDRVETEAQVGDVHESADHPAGGRDVGGLAGGDQ